MSVSKRLTCQVTFRVDGHIHKQLHAIASRSDRTVPAVLRIILRDWLKQQQISRAPTLLREQRLGVKS